VNKKTPMKRGGIADSMSQQKYAVRPASKGDSFDWALVKDGAVVTQTGDVSVTSGYSADKPEGYSTFHPVGCEWIRIAGNADSEPFDPAKHYRGIPSLVVQGDEVIRLYPVQARGAE
jgi:hypothetical protein